MRPLRFLRRIRAACATSWRRLRRESHHGRWSRPDALYPAWDERARIVAALIPPATRVLDLGAGSGSLAGLLPEGCSYRGADLVPRDGATFVCDLNARPLPELPDHDVAVLAGVLEFLHDPERLLRALARRGSQVVASYALRGPGAGSWFHRRGQGWFNDFTAEELDALYRRAGFHVAEETFWRGQRIVRLLPAQAGSPS